MQRNKDFWKQRLLCMSLFVFCFHLQYKWILKQIIYYRLLYIWNITLTTWLRMVNVVFSAVFHYCLRSLLQVIGKMFILDSNDVTACVISGNIQSSFCEFVIRNDLTPLEKRGDWAIDYWLKFWKCSCNS